MQNNDSQRQRHSLYCVHNIYFHNLPWIAVRRYIWFNICVQNKIDVESDNYDSVNDCYFDIECNANKRYNSL